MTVKNIVLKINAKKSTLDTLNIEGGEFGHGSQGKPLKIAAKANVHYEFTDKETSFGPENIATKRHDKDLWISFEGGDVDQPDLIIENYYAANGELGYSEGESNLLIGQHENGKYYPYVPESAEKNDAVSLLADQVEAGQALGGEEVAAFWAFNPLWLLALVPIAAVAIGQGHDNNKKSPVIEHPQHVPIAEKDSAETKENTPVIIDVTTNDTDKDGDLDPSTVVITKQPQNGTVSVDPITGEVTYTPNKGYVGPDEFEYTVKDKAGNVSDPATVVVEVSANPVAVDDSAETKEDTPIIIDVTANDTDKDGDLDPSTVVITKQPQNGTVSVDPITGEVTYTPNKGYVGPDEFEYTVKDKAGNVSDPATVVVEVSANPVAVDDSVETKEDTPIIIDVTANDTDKDGDLDPSTVVITKQPQNGTISVDPITGEVTYTPNKGYVGPDEFEYTVKDKAGNVSDPATVVVEVSANPVAVDDSANTKEDTPIIIDVTANDTDKDGDLDPSTVVVTKQPQHGTVSVDPITGEVTYTPNKGYVGPDQFEYTVKDKAGNASDPATVVIDITANPVAVDDSAETKEDTPIIIDVTSNDTDKDGDLDPSTVVITKQPQHGTVSIDPITGEVTYTPNKGYVGPDAFEYTVKDKAGNVSDPASVVIDITANPVAVDDSAETKEDTPIIIDVTANDSDKDGDLDPSTVVITKQPQNGTVSIDPITGEVTYTPNKGYVGSDAFEYTVKDKAGNVSDSATVVVEVSANPVAVDDSANTKEDTPIIIDVTANDSDKDGDLDPSTVVVMKQPQNGTVSVDPITGEVTYTPNKGYVGPDQFEYTVKDKAGNVSDPATVVIDITANPVAVDDSAETKQDTPIIIDVTANDTDKDGDLDPSTVVITKQPQHGTVSVDPITGEVTYTPNKGYVGPDAFEYTVQDKAGNVSDPATVVIEVSANPIAVDDSANTKEDTPIIIDVTANDTDKDGDLDPSTVVITKQPQHGTVSVDPITGEVTYTPNKGYVGPDAFEYTVKDKAGNVSDPATVVVEVSANPVAVDDSANTKEDTPIIIDVTANDTDKDGDLDPSTVVISKQPQHGTVSVDPVTGEVTYTPNKGYVGPDQFEYTVKDKAGNVSDPATVVVEVSANPVAVDDSANTKEDTPIIIDVTANDTDKDGDLDPSTVVISKQPQHGTVSVDPITGEVTYTPNKGYVGPDAFEYTVKDKAGNVSDPATVVIDITANPVAVDDSANTKEDTPIIIDVTANDTDKDGDLDPSTVVITKQPQNGTVSVDPISGEVTYTPNKGYVGPDQFEYTVKDKAGNVSDPATVVIDITANPVAVDDSANTKEDTPIIIDVTANDTDKDGDLDPSTVVITKQPQNGTVSVDPVTGEVTYTPNKGYVGPDAFEYTVKDKAGNVSDPATVVIEVSANPVAVDDSANTKEDTPIIIDVTANDTDKDGDLDPSTVVITKQPQNGTVSVDPITGEVTYTPNKGYVGPDAFEYTVKDKAGNVSDPAHVTLDISPTGTLTEILKEADLGDGSTASVVNGELSLDNPSNADISDILMTLPTVDVTSGGETINWTQTANGGLVGTTPSGQEVMSITLGTPVTSNGKTTIPYEIGLKAPVDHVGENSERLDLDFGINTNIGDANLIITVEDDKSVAAPISVVADGETTFYANVIISLDLSSSMGARDSGIPDPVNGGEKMRMNAAVEAIETMLDKYQEQLDSVAPGNGDVKVNIIGFSKLAKHLSLPGQTDTWVSLDDAKKIVKGLYNFGTRPKDIGVDTNYDAALQEVIHSYLNNQGAGPVVGVDGAKVNNSLLFVSDGIPNFGNGTDGVRGIQPTSPSNYEPGNQNIDIGEDKWTAFLKEQNIKSIAIGIGPQMDEGADFLKPIAFDGEKGTNKDGSSDIIILKDMSDLGGIMSELVPEATDTQGSIRTDDVGNIVSSFGADGAGQLIIQIDGYDYTYDYATNQITSSNSNASIWQDAGNGVLMVKTEIGGSFKLNMSADKFGEFSYNPAPTRPVGKTQEEFTFTLVDKDGDKSSDKLLIDIQLIPEASASKAALSMSNQLDHLEVFNAVGHTLDGFANTPNPAEVVNTNHINVSQHLEQLSVEQPNLI
ncbi:Ig-like domain-containing protein [Acinetobacter guillouiae]|uniref:Ig-like domain-containing protein n=1 Tax=Acinetobacter guillouiae TaxID=106649 RepID=UPI003D086162